MKTKTTQALELLVKEMIESKKGVKKNVYEAASLLFYEAGNAVQARFQEVSECNNREGSKLKYFIKLTPTLSTSDEVFTYILTGADKNRRDF